MQQKTDKKSFDAAVWSGSERGEKNRAISDGKTARRAEVTGLTEFLRHPLYK